MCRKQRLQRELQKRHKTERKRKENVRKFWGHFKEERLFFGMSLFLLKYNNKSAIIHLPISGQEKNYT